MDSLCRSKTYVQAIVRYGGVYWGLGIVRDALPWGLHGVYTFYYIYCCGGCGISGE